MGFGLFGKLPQKRDFVASGIPRAVLSPFETWLQSAVAASRAELGRDWESYYLVAPIWRFWIGHGVFGQPCAGALMPSVDKVGRFFPLAILYCGEPGEAWQPPVFDARDEWFEALEARLLSVLDEEAQIEVEAVTAGLPDAAGAAEPPPPPGTAFKTGVTWRGEAGSSPAALVSSLVQADYWRAASTRSFWWTGGGASGMPMAHICPGLPDAWLFARMLRLED